MNQKIANEIAAFTAMKPLIRYDAEQGRVFWAVKPSLKGRAKVGDELGTVSANKYRAFSFWGKGYLVHRLIFWLEKGYLPEVIDHKVGDLNERGEKDNRIGNLRESNQTLNNANRSHQKNNKLGLKGVYRAGNRFRAAIRIKGKCHNLGRFDTPEEAHAAYVKAAGEAWGDHARATNTAFGSITVGLDNLTAPTRDKLKRR